MAFEFNSRGDITMPSGDSASITFSITGSGITLGETDSIHFVVYDKYNDVALIEKDVTIVDGLATVDLSPSDTALTPDDYTWNVRVMQGATVVLSAFAVSPRFTLTEVE
jgi:hypothetical protein